MEASAREGLETWHVGGYFLEKPKESCIHWGLAALS